MAFPRPHGQVADRVVGSRWPSIDETAWGADAGVDLRAAHDDRVSADELRGHARQFGQSAGGEAFDAHRHALEAHAQELDREAEAKDRSAAVRDSVGQDAAAAKESIDRIVRVTELQIQAHEALCRALRADPSPGRELLLQQGSGAVDSVVQSLQEKISGHGAQWLAVDRQAGKEGGQTGSAGGRSGAADSRDGAKGQGGPAQSQARGSQGQEDWKRQEEQEQEGRATGLEGLTGVVDAVARTSRPLSQEAGGGSSSEHGGAADAGGSAARLGSPVGSAAEAAGGSGGMPARGEAEPGDGAAPLAAGGAAFGSGVFGARPSSSAEQERRGGKKDREAGSAPTAGAVRADVPLAPTVSGVSEAAAHRLSAAASPTALAGSVPLFVPEAAERPVERSSDQAVPISDSAVMGQPRQGLTGERAVARQLVDWQSTGAAEAFRGSVGPQTVSPPVLGAASPSAPERGEPEPPEQDLDLGTDSPEAKPGSDETP